MCYLFQQYALPNRKVAGLLIDIGTEELAHMELIISVYRTNIKNI